VVEIMLRGRKQKAQAALYSRIT